MRTAIRGESQDGLALSLGRGSRGRADIAADPEPWYASTVLILLSLTACALISPAEFEDRQDFDGDGYIAAVYGGDDCDDAAAAVFPGAEEVCDGVDNNCDGDADGDAVDISVWYADQDGDGYGGGSVQACQRPEGYVELGGDCRDGDANTNPGATEIWYDGTDQDCDENDDDQDLDGYGSDAHGGTDCNDLDDSVNPGATEVYYDGVDADCSDTSDNDQDGDGQDSDAYGGADCDDTEALTFDGAQDDWYDGVDADCDGLSDYDADGDGFDDPLGGGEDCDDVDLDVYPGAPEYCDDVDQDCDGDVADADAVDALSWYVDADEDGYGTGAASYVACGQEGGYSAIDGDCDDGDSDAWPGAPEAWYDGADANCDSASDFDADADGYDSADWDGGDCDDANAAVFPSATELCDTVDSDCDGEVAEADSIDAPVWYLDADADGYGSASASTQGCEAPAGYASDDLDCDDLVAAVNPGAAEVCDADDVDENCDGLANDDDPSATGSVDAYIDSDGDGFGSGAATSSCGTPDGYADNDLDCAVSDATIGPYCQVDLSDADAKFLGINNYDYAGASVAGAGDVNNDGFGDVIIGVYGDDTVGTYAGATHVILGPVSGNVPLSSPDATLLGEVAYDYSGQRVAGAGDVNDDGFDDLLIGAPYEPTGGAMAGAAYLVLGPVSGSNSLAAAEAKLTGEVADDRAGFAISAAGDVNDDDIADLLVGAYQDGTGGFRGGATYLFLGPVSGVQSLSAADSKIYSEDAGDYVGYSVAGAGDVDADGFDDIVTGAPCSDGDGGYWRGAAYLVLGPVSGAVDLAIADAKIVGEADSDQVGWSVSGAGDTNADGYDDLLLGSTYGGSGSMSGAAYIVLGPEPGDIDATEAGAKLDGESDYDGAGYSVAGVGDMDVDGYDDVLVSAWADDDGGSGAGAAYLVYGPVSGIQELSLVGTKFLGEAGSDVADTSVAAGGDIDWDGIPDLLIGAPEDNTYSTDSGAAYLLLGASL